MHHPQASLPADAKDDPRRSLVRVIMERSLAGSAQNSVTVVFDGYPPSRGQPLDLPPYLRVRFSMDVSADEVIRELIERSGMKRSLVVVSADKEVVFFARAHKAQVRAPEEFLSPERRRGCRPGSAQDQGGQEITYSQMDEINRELRGKWLKKK